MSSIATLSTFYYGHTVTESNRYIDFSEDGIAELTGILDVGDYTLTEYAAALADAMTAVGSQTYSAAIARATRVITLSAPGVFELWITSGSHLTTTAYTMAGFTGADTSSATSHAGTGASGSEYKTQYPMADYISPEDFYTLESATVNVSAKGIVQVVNFGEGRRMQGTIRLITNRASAGYNSPFYVNATGVANARTFMRYLITKAKVEFMPDYATPNTFFALLLESAPADRDGTGFNLQNMGMSDFYQTGKLLFREVQS